MPHTFNIAEFKQAVERHWRYHSPCRTLLWNVQEADDEWQIEVAPPFQEVFGGEQDGIMVWAALRFDLSGFSTERGVLIDSLLASSYCIECNQTPYVGLRGTYLGRAFSLRLHLEPIPNTEPVEIIDTIKHQVRDFKETQP
jgi:hypothetical protein